MTSRFVSGGTITAADAGAAPDPAPSASSPSFSSATPGSASATQPSTTTSATAAPSSSSSSSTAAASSAWERAQAQLASERAAREAARRNAIEGGGPGGLGGQPSLYETLQANKAAKQAAFEEASRLRNQFRALDDDEVDFLEGVVASERREEERRRQELEDGLRGFRERQRMGGEAAPAAADEDGEPVGEDPGEAGADPVGGVDATEAAAEWAVPAARKRKREKEHGIKGLKRRVSGADVQKDDATTTAATEDTRNGCPEDGTTGGPASQKATGSSPAAKVQKMADKVEAAQSTTPPKAKMGLVDYGSDDDDD